LKTFIGTCITNPFRTVEELSKVIHAGKRIAMKTFLANCDIDETTRELMRAYPQDFEFFKSGEIYFYEYTSIDCFYVEVIA
jgi:hypothetical protein